MSKHHQRVIVVGAGMGGLAAALKLSSQGVPVSVIERHNHAGGKVRQVRVADKLIDVGPTVFTMRWVFDALFEEAGLAFSDHVHARSNALLARHSWVGSDPLDLYSCIDQSTEAIESFSGAKDAQAYRDFAYRSKAIYETLNRPFMQSHKPSVLSLTFSHGIAGILKMAQTQPYQSLWASLSRSFSDPRLIQLFARYATYCGSSPFQAPATLMLIAHVEREGVWVLEGGMSALATAVQSAAQSLGCEFHFGHEVETIRTDASGVLGVQLTDGTPIDASAVVFNGDTNALTLGLLGESSTSAVRSSKANSLSAITRAEVAQTEGFELAHHNVFFGGDYGAEFDAIFKRKTLCADPTIYVCAQDRGDAVEHPKSAERLFSLMNAPAQSISPPEIENACKQMTQRLQSHGLRLSNHQGTNHIDTPVTFAQRFPATQGALYGRPTHGMMGSFKRPGSHTAIRGLYLTGGSVHPGAGVPMVTLSGQLAAQGVLDHLAKS